VVTCGATPIFADVDLVSQNVTAESIRAVLTPRTRAVIVVHLAGMPCEMDDICALVNDKGLYLIEDCAQAHGADYRGRKAGSFGHASVFSFCTDKIISTGGEGGMMLLREEAHWRRAWSYKDHGKDYDLFTKKSPGRHFRWIHNSIGSNFRMTEFQAAIGLRQLTKLEDWLEARRIRADLLDQALRGAKVLRTTPRYNHIRHANYKYYAFVRPENLKPDWSRDRILNEAAAQGAPCQSGGCPEIYRERAFGGGANYVNGAASPTPNARLLGETSILMPIDQTLTLDEVRQMGKIMREVAEEAAA
jgi:dTDP-4-amino-4,6-dideoxygalactose transaminase